MPTITDFSGEPIEFEADDLVCQLEVEEEIVGVLQGVELSVQAEFGHEDDDYSVSFVEEGTLMVGYSE